MSVFIPTSIFYSWHSLSGLFLSLYLLFNYTFFISRSLALLSVSPFSSPRFWWTDHSSKAAVFAAPGLQSIKYHLSVQGNRIDLSHSYNLSAIQPACARWDTAGERTVACLFCAWLEFHVLVGLGHTIRLRTFWEFWYAYPSVFLPVCRFIPLFIYWG